MASDQLPCNELVELVTDYLEQALPSAERARCEAHLAACPYCLTYVEQMRQTIRVLGQLIDESVAPEAKEGLVRRFRSFQAAR